VESPENASEVDAVVLEEAAVLCGQHGINQYLWSLIDGDELPFLSFWAEKQHDLLRFEFQKREELTIIRVHNRRDPVLYEPDLDWRPTPLPRGNIQIMEKKIDEILRCSKLSFLGGLLGDLAVSEAAEF
jgi:hypothetical protein